MKKIKITLLVLLTVVTVSFSADAKFGIGPKIGTSISKLNLSGDNWKDNFKTGNRAGFTAGLTGEYIAPAVGLGADISLMYNYQSSEVEMGDTKETVKGHFFEIPLHLKYKISIPAAEKIVAPYIYTGPNVAFKVGGDDNYFKTKKTQWGWDLGLGLELVKHLQIGAGYTFGMNNIANKTKLSDKVDITDNIKVKNNYWTVTAAWMF